MIQDIAPSKLYNEYRPLKPEKDDTVLVFDDKGGLFSRITDGHIDFTHLSDAGDEDAQYLFSVDDKRYFLTLKPAPDSIEGFGPRPIRQLRDEGNGNELFAAFTAYHLWRWYSDNKFCGSCGGIMAADDKERAQKCTKCGKIVYPRINPAVIVGVINGDSILITRYRTGYAHNALVAGFTEIGETLEETVQREVMEEAGIRVKNIRYYKSQPWGMALDLLAGFYCEVDGDDTIRMDDNELKYAQWVRREDIVLQPNDLSLTNEMMRMFRDHKETE